MFSAFYLILHETFSNSYGFSLMQEFNPSYPDLVLYDRKPFCSIFTDLSNLLFLFHLKFPLVSYDVKNVLTVSKNAEAAACKCSSEAVAQRCSVKNMFVEISQNSQKNICITISLLIKLQGLVSACIFIKKRLWHR